MNDNNINFSPVMFAIEIIEEAAPTIDLSYLHDIDKKITFAEGLLVSRIYMQALIDTKQLKQQSLDVFNKRYYQYVASQKVDEARTFTVTLDKLTWLAVDQMCKALQADPTCQEAKDIDEAISHFFTIWAQAGLKPGSWQSGVFAALGLMPHIDRLDELELMSWSDGQPGGKKKPVFKF